MLYMWPDRCQYVWPLPGRYRCWSMVCCDGGSKGSLPLSWRICCWKSSDLVRLVCGIVPTCSVHVPSSMRTSPLCARMILMICSAGVRCSVSGFGSVGGISVQSSGSCESADGEVGLWRTIMMASRSALAGESYIRLSWCGSCGGIVWGRSTSMASC